MINLTRVNLVFCMIITLVLSIKPYHAISQVSQIPDIDLAKVRVDDLTDDQVKKFVDKAASSGLTQQDLETAAQAKGMKATEIQKLRDRITKLKLDQNLQKTQPEAAADRMREMNVQELTPKQEPVEKDKMSELFDIIKSEEQKKIETFEQKIFGYSLFNTKNLTFEPSLNIPTPQNYQIGPGDEIVIDVWGASQQNYRLKVSPEGNIVIDNVGPVFINGLTIDKASSKIINRLSGIYAGLSGSNPNTYAQISIGNMRSIKITLVGDVRVPGSYTLPSLASVFNALYLSGGPSINGSFRNISVFRENKLVATLDIYDFLIKGDQKNNIRLQDQDMVMIKPYKTRVEIQGEIKRPALYEMGDNEHLSDLLEFAGGFSEKAYSYRLKVIRNSSKEYKIQVVEKKDFSSFTLGNGDLITVEPILNKFENKVDIEGAVYRPGQFELTANLTLKQLIDKAEGLKGDAFMTRAIVFRLRPDLTMESLPVDLNALITNNSADVPLMKDDSIKIYSIFELQEEFSLQAIGEVLNPGIYPYIKNMNLEDFIAITGGFKESASLARIEISRRIKSSDIKAKSAKVADIFQFTVSRDLNLSDSASKFILEPFDIVSVRRSPGYEFQAQAVVRGEVLYPGSYSISNKDERISDLVNRAGGLTPEGYIKGARLIRKLPINIRERAKIMQSIESQSTDSVKIAFSNEKEQAIGINLEQILKNPKSKFDIILQEGDILEIPKELQTVRLSGAFLYPITVRYDKNYGFKKYAALAGGFAENAKPNKSFVVYANGAVDRTSNFLFFNVYPKIEPGAEIIVPKKVEKKDKMTSAEFLAISTAISSLAAVMISAISILSK
jgi:protein involved in polysaccharide export with SLBB domain